MGAGHVPVVGPILHGLIETDVALEGIAGAAGAVPNGSQPDALGNSVQSFSEVVDGPVVPVPAPVEVPVPVDVDVEAVGEMGTAVLPTGAGALNRSVHVAVSGAADTSADVIGFDAE
jgi:hypothetical protein